MKTIQPIKATRIYVTAKDIRHGKRFDCEVKAFIRIVDGPNRESPPKPFSFSLRIPPRFLKAA